MEDITMKQYAKPTLTLLNVDVNDILLASEGGLTVDENVGDVSGDPIIFASGSVDVFGE